MQRALLLLALALLLAPGSAKHASPPPAPPPLPVDSLLTLAQVLPTPSPPSSSSPSSAAAPTPHPQPRHPLTPADLVYATGTCRDRMQLAKSSRSWRRGLRAFLLTDTNSTDSLARLNADGAAHNEAYAFFPDDGDPALGGLRHGTKAGDTRAAVAPFAAHRHFGDTYKWMLYGDDDTLFFLDPVMKLLSDFDPELPLAFSDNLWYRGVQPNPHAPRCLPCAMAAEELPDMADIQRTPPMRDLVRKWLQLQLGTRNLSAEAIDAAVEDPTERPGYRYLPRPVCPHCTPEGACPRQPNPGEQCVPSVPHGGAGMILSVGLMRSIPYPAALGCIRSFLGAPGGDHIVAHCLWRHGVAFTDPGPLVRHSYNPYYHTFGGKAGVGFLFDPVGSMTRGRCNATCRWVLRNTLSLHLKGRHFRSWRSSAIHMWGVAAAVEAARSFLDLVSRDGGLAWRELPYGADMDDATKFAAYTGTAMTAEG